MKAKQLSKHQLNKMKAVMNEKEKKPVENVFSQLNVLCALSL